MVGLTFRVEDAWWLSANDRKEVIHFSILGEPVSKARARFTNYGSKTRAYTPQKTLSAEAAVAAAFRVAGGRFEPSTEVTFGVSVQFFNGTRQRRDVDNMLKLVLDALNGVAWVDDMQVAEVMARKSITARPDARTDVTVYRIGDVDRLTKPCVHCAKPFVTYESLVDRTRFCSAECRSRARVAARQRTCEQCGETFLAHGRESAPRFCSKECRSQNGKVTIPCSVCGTPFEQYRSWAKRRCYCSPECVAEMARRRAKDRRTRVFPGSCLSCGAGTTRKEYRRCNPCKLAGKEIEGQP